MLTEETDHADRCCTLYQKIPQNTTKPYDTMIYEREHGKN